MDNRFYYKIENINGKDVITLGYKTNDIVSRDLLIKVSPPNGNNLFCFKIGDYDVIHYDNHFKLTSYYTGNPILYPIPNRLRNCQYEFKGKKYWQMKNGIPIFLHSLVYDENWDYKNPVIDKDSVSVETFIKVDENHPIFEGFPFKHTLIVIYKLTYNKLTISYEVKNEDKQELPFGISFHTFFNKLSGDNGSLICVPAKYMMELTDDLLPTGKLLEVEGEPFDLRSPVAVSGLDLDNCFTGMEKGKSVVIDYSTIGLKVFMDSTEDFTHMQVFTPKGKPFFCVEKQTCSTDVFNLDAKGLKDESHLIVVPSHTNFKGSVDFSYEFYNK